MLIAFSSIKIRNLIAYRFLRSAHARGTTISINVNAKSGALHTNLGFETRVSVDESENWNKIGTVNLDLRTGPCDFHSLITIGT